MIVGFTTTCAISVYHHLSSNPIPDEVYLIEHYVIKFVSNLRQFPISSINKTDGHDITEIFLKVALSTINPRFSF